MRRLCAQRSRRRRSFIASSWCRLRQVPAATSAASTHLSSFPTTAGASITTLTLTRFKGPPPPETGAEAGYLRALGEKKAQVTVKLLGGEKLRGWIEYYDQNMLRLTREGAPNLFIFKHEIAYIAEETGRRL